MANGQWRRTAQRTSFIRNLGAEYVEPCAKEAMAREAAELEGLQPLAWHTRLLVLSSCRACETLMDGWLKIDGMSLMSILIRNLNHIR
jgi:hypothetical protein